MKNQTKHILAFLRDGDFAHPGETEAIDLAMQPILKDKNRNVLDIGCGLGGTAKYLLQNGFGNATGIDIDANNIEYASKKYPEILFVQCDVLQATQYLREKYQLMVCFSALFCFPKQQEALKQLSLLADNNCELMIFDYAQYDDTPIESPFQWSSTASQFKPIYLKSFEKILADSGWNLTSSIDTTSLHKKWYEMLLHRFERKKAEMVKHFDADLVNKMQKGYELLLQLINEKKVGGVVVYAKRTF